MNLRETVRISGKFKKELLEIQSQRKKEGLPNLSIREITDLIRRSTYWPEIKSDITLYYEE